MSARARAGWLLAGLLGLAGCKGEARAQPAAADAAPAVTKRIVRVDPGALDRLGITVEPAGTEAPHHRLHVPGTLDYSYTQYADIGTLVEGRIMSISAGVGDRVKKGQVLATMLVPALARSQADFVSARAAAKVAHDHAQRETSLLEKNLTTAREAESANAEQIRTQAELEAARARLQAIGAGVPLSGSVGGAGRLPLITSIAGTVVRRDAVLGKFMQPNETAFVVAELSELWAQLQVHESDLPYLQVGSDVDLTVDAQPGEVFKGKLSLIEPQVGSTSRSARARVVVPNPGEKLRPGLFVRAAIAIPESNEPNHLLIPTDAVQTLGEADVVFVELSKGEFEAKEVRLSRKTAEVSDVLAGIQKGERIAVTGTFLLRNEVIKQ